MEIAELLAREGVRLTMALYNRYGDAREYDNLVEVFHPDAEMVIQGGTVLAGRERIIEALRAGARTRGAYESGNSQRHHLTTSMIEVTGENTARARHYIIVITELGFDHTGSYTDEFEKHGDRWLIRRRQASMDWARSDSRFVKWLGDPAAAVADVGAGD